jgi:hypothetical protein
MLGRLLRGVLAVALIVLGGLAFALVGFGITSATSYGTYLGPLCADTVASHGFDPWTGEPHGRIYDAYVCPPVPPDNHVFERRVVGSVPPDMLGRPIITYPVGFLLGCLLTAAVLLVRGRRRAHDRAAPQDHTGPLPA